MLHLALTTGLKSWEYLPAIVLSLVMGSAVGSFLNVVVYRLPAGLSLLHPPSHCPKCLHRLGPTDNVPVLGWLWLRGKCRYCGTKISPRYPLVEAATALLFLLVTWQFGLTLQTLAYWFLVALLISLALIDRDTLTLPNRLTEPGLVMGLIAQAGLGYWAENSLAGAGAGLLSGLLAMALGIWLFQAISFGGAIALGRPAMGAGDAKLAAMIGAWLGWKLLLITSFLACVYGAFIGGGAIAIGLLKRGEPMPFGPFLALGALTALLWGNDLWDIYWRFFTGA